MLVAAIGVALRHRLGARPRRGGDLPGAVRPQRRLLPPDGARGRPGRSSCAPRSARSPTRASTARWWSRPWGARRPRPPGSPPGRRAARRADRGRPAARRVRPDAGDAARPRHPRRAGGRRGPAAPGRGHRHRTGQRGVPVHRARLPGPGDRLGPGRAAAQRRRLGPRPAGAHRHRRHAVRHVESCPSAAEPAELAFDRGRRFGPTPTAAQPVLHDVSFTVPGRPDGGPGRPDRLRASRPSPRWRSA